jgi:hypothetical protein
MPMQKKYIFTITVLSIAILMFSLGASCSLCSKSLVRSDASSSIISNENIAENTLSEEEKKLALDDKAKALAAEITLTEEERKLAQEDKAKALAAGISTATSSSETGSSNSSGPAASSTTPGDTSTATSPGTTSASTPSGSMPVLSLRIYEGPTFSSADSIYYYRVEALIAGSSPATVTFSRDDSHGAWGTRKSQVNLLSGQSYTLTAIASNSSGSASASLNLTAPGSTASPPSSTSGTNRIPTAGDINLPGTTLLTNFTYTASVSASDPDGDTLSYNWSVTGGSIADPVSNPVNWRTPGAASSYTINVLISDGRGGSIVKTRNVTVNIPTAGVDPSAGIITVQNMNLPLVYSEGGYIERSGYINSGGCLYVGDSNNNRNCNGYLSFDISGIAGSSIQSASLTFNLSNTYGSPSPFFTNISIFALYWGASPLTGAVDDTPAFNVDYLASPSFVSTSSLIASRLQDAINSGRNRFQLRIGVIPGWSDSNNAWDGWEYQQSNISLNINYLPAY